MYLEKSFLFCRTTHAALRAACLVLPVLVVGGCAPRVVPPAQLQPVNQIVEKPITVPPPDLKMQYNLTYGDSPALKKAYQQYLKTGKAPNIITDGFEQFAYGIGNQPVIAASPLALTVISLEPNERVTNVSSGDPLRWSYSLAYSGQDKVRQAHIMVKPSQVDISTDLVITTDKRLYTLHLTAAANNGKHAHNVRFWYPQEMRDSWGNHNAEQTQKIMKENQDIVAEVPNINLNNLNFNYRVASGGWFSPSWKPIRVFDDGVRTYIQFPATIGSRDMPALFILNGGNKDLVNYRAKLPYFVVDKIFAKAILISGVGSAQSTVTISNYGY
jgi:type IV secretion system protein TrbG